MPGRDNQINDTLSLEEQNHLLLQETLRIVRKMHRIYLTQFILTIIFVVLPIIASVAFLPSMIRSFSSSLQSITNPQTTAQQQDQLNSILNQLQGGSNAQK